MYTTIASLSEYIDTKQCDTLEGPDGAYSKYEMLTRLEKIDTKLDGVIIYLNQIKENQFYLYSAIIENTNKLDKITANTAVTAYTVQVIERNQYYGRSVKDGILYDDRLNMPEV